MLLDQSLSREQCQTAATLLAELRLRRGGRDAQIDELPEPCRPRSPADAYRIQSELRELLSADLGAQVGWKIGCTTTVMQRYLNIAHPCAGTLYRHTARSGPLTLRLDEYFRLGLECELAVRLSDDLPARRGGYDAAGVAGAVGAVMTSIEIVDERFVDFRRVGAASLIADDFFSAGCAFGAECTPREAGDLAALSGGFMIDGQPDAARGRGAEILGQPLAALAWLADQTAAFGRPLTAGQVISLGSVVKTIYPSGPAVIEARFDRLAAARVELV